MTIKYTPWGYKESDMTEWITHSLYLGRDTKHSYYFF